MHDPTPPAPPDELGHAHGHALGVLTTWTVLDAALGVYLAQSGLSATSILLLGLSALLFALAMFRFGRDRPVFPLDRLVVGLVVVHLLAFAVRPYRPFVPEPPGVFQALAALTLGAVLVGAAVRQPVKGLGIAIFMGLAARGLVILLDSPPTFDVPYLQATAGHDILAGINPYVMPFVPQGYPYWPFSAVAAAAGLLIGDARWSSVGADAMTAGALIWLALRVGMSGRMAAGIAALWLWTFAGLFVTWEGFPEPILVALAAVATAALAQARWAVAGFLVGLAVATKQFGVALLPFLALLPIRVRLRTLPVAVLTAVAIIAPFVIWSPDPFIAQTIQVHLAEPARGFSLNLLEPAPGLLPRIHLPFALAAALGLAAGLAVWSRFRGSTAGWLASSAAVLLAVFLVNDIAFVNYYQLVLGLLALLIVVPDGAWPTRLSPA